MLVLLVVFLPEVKFGALHSPNVSAGRTPALRVGHLPSDAHVDARRRRRHAYQSKQFVD
jgi:hypothetical protein